MSQSDYSIDDLHAFGLIVAAGGISAAARTAERSKASLSRSVSRLESIAGAPLFDRIGRGLRLTPLGETLCESAERALEVRRQADDALRSARGTPSGPLRVAASNLVAQYLLAPVLGRLALAYPKIDISLRATSPSLNPLADDLDVVFRIGRPEEENLVARRVASSPLRLYAGRDLARAHDVGDERVVQRLGRITVDAPGVPPHWRLQDDEGRTMILESRPLLSVEDPSIAIAVLDSGVGIGCLPAAYAERLVDERRLARVLPRFRGAVVELYATLAPRRASVPAVRAFLDAVIDHADALSSTPGRPIE